MSVFDLNTAKRQIKTLRQTAETGIYMGDSRTFMREVAESLAALVSRCAHYEAHLRLIAEGDFDGDCFMGPQDIARFALTEGVARDV